MKCELCHNAEAETAIATGEGDDELYVCKECARREKVRRQNSKRSVRKTSGGPRQAPPRRKDGGESAIEGGGEVPPEMLEALADAARGLADDLDTHLGRNAADAAAGGREDAPPPPPPPVPDAPVDISFLPAAQSLAGGMQLEGLYLIGDLECVGRALRALDISMEGLSLDGISDAGHVFAFKCVKGAEEAAARVIRDLSARERSARASLETDYRRVIGDAACRALAILKSCRLLSQGELFDLLSPLRLAAQSHYLDGMDAREIDKLMKKAVRQANKEEANPDVRDRVDGELADRMNNMFEDVILGEKGERDFL